MRRFPTLLAAVLVVIAVPARAQEPDPLREGLEAALRGCEAWVLEPETWSADLAPFLARVGLAGRVSETEALPEPLLPPPTLRRDNRYFRIAAGGENGYALVVSEGIPMCHVTGGGDRDLQPAAEAVIDAPSFNGRWERVEEGRENGIVSTLLRSREDGAFTLLFSRAEAADARRDRPQVVLTAFYDLRR